jgi:hypothetical protein
MSLTVEWPVLSNPPVAVVLVWVVIVWFRGRLPLAPRGEFTGSIVTAELGRSRGR